MSDYTELVKALHRCDMKQGCFNANCRYSVGKYFCDMDKVHKDAAAAIEELQAEKKKTVTQIFCEEQIAWEGRCKDLMYQIADLQAQLPKQGEWLNVTDSYSWYGKCSVCGEEFVVDAYYAGGMNYCPNCGAKMEVQDGKRCD